MNGSNEIGPICDLPLDLQKASRKGRVMVVGAGGLGCPLIKILLDNGIDDICIIEPGEIKLNNLHRQILYDYGDVGLSKASVIEKRLHSGTVAFGSRSVKKVSIQPSSRLKNPT